ncbi:hypothetical protein AFA91_32520 [Mycolicibacterium goodii]|uniref:Uncharacterized protein n=1 Tax=Mycolicibacterium goodii TaxID=134601 RepID=A0A0K0XEN5_MYCGD|nr:hypothetical protein AFA91_32520 [Mycolicibacterium goodii]
MVHAGLVQAMPARDVGDVPIGIGGEPGQVAGVVIAKFPCAIGVNAARSFRHKRVVRSFLRSAWR